MYIRYIKKLYELHITANNYVEAGLTLLQEAQLLRWSDDCYSHDWERKEELYLQILSCFDKGMVSRCYRILCPTNYLPTGTYY
jgi:dedicator of cytokinesis protein 3